MKKLTPRNINNMEKRARFIVHSGLYSFTFLDNSLTRVFPMRDNLVSTVKVYDS